MKVQFRGKRIIHQIEENIYTIDVPDELKDREIEAFIYQNKNKINLINQEIKHIISDDFCFIEFQDKNIYEIDIEKQTNQCINNEYKNATEQNTEEPMVLEQTHPLYINKQTDHIVVKENLNQCIIKNDHNKFREYYQENKNNLTNLDFYLLLHNALHNHNTEISLLLLQESYGILKEPQLVKIIKQVGIVDNEDIVNYYIQNGFSIFDYEGEKLKDLYLSKNLAHIAKLF